MKSILSVVIGATLALSAIEADAEASPGERQVSLTIESSSLATALDKWAQQTGFQIFVQDWEATKNLHAPSLNGTFAAQDALNQLLSGTSLTYVWIDSKTVSIRKKAAQTVPTALQRTSLEGQPATPAAKFTGDDAGNAASSAAAALDGETPNSPNRLRLEEVLVVGTHISGLRNNTVPIISLDREYIDSSGIATTTRLIETLPQNFALANQSAPFNPAVSGPPTQSSSINLRGLGEGTTLVLLNGRRMALGFGGSAADITALPLTAVERVEVLTDGASALYGSDAVGGVVNFVLRKDFEGAETRIQIGQADGLDEYRISQALGTAWSSGNAMTSIEYYKRDLLHASDRDYVPADAGVGSLLPRDENYSVLVSGRQEISDTIALSADGLYTQRDSYNESSDELDHSTFTADNPQMTLNAGLDWNLGAGWNAEVSGGYARNRMESVNRADSLLTSGAGGEAISTSQFEIETARVKADGTLFALPGGDVSAAVGADWRSESLEYAIFWRSGAFSLGEQLDQTVRSLFAQVYAPLVGSSNGRPGIRRLELSLAGRYDEYSSFGSSFDPQYGVMWEPLSGLMLRASYGTSYVAPKLASYSLTGNQGAAFYLPDAASPSVLTHVLQIQGNAVETYVPQESKNWTFGFEWSPPNAVDLQISMNYYRIEYTDRLADLTPYFVEMLNDEEGFAGLAIRDPSQAEVESFVAIGELGGIPLLAFDPDFNPDPNFDPSSVDVILDQRTRNLSVVKTDGVDLSVQYALQAGASRLQWALMGSYILELKNQVTHSSKPFDPLDTYRNPLSLRMRGSFGWQRGAWQANLFANYTDSYDDNRFVPPREIGSNLTFDTRFAYQWEKGGAGLLSGVTLAASVQNLFDRDPPHTQSLLRLSDIGFDPMNASPLGRLIAIEFTKNW